MNINLIAAAAKQRKNPKQQKSKNILYGLNDRKKSQNHKCRKKSVFSNCESSSDDDANAAPETSTTGGRIHVNRALVAEQAALRNRAEVTMALSTTAASDVFDYDGQYESFSSGYHNKSSKKLEEDSGQKKAMGKEKKESRYVSDLLLHAKNRQQEREIIGERKIAREQAEDEKEYIGKEKFVTKAYKRKLVERESWLMGEKERSKREEAEDGRKNKDGSAVMTSFYGNLARNIAMGASHMGEIDKTKKSPQNSIMPNDSRIENDTHKCNIDNSEPKLGSKPRMITSSLKEAESSITTSEEGTKQVELVLKILSARERYLNRSQVARVI